jgi:hypothetical protein
VQSVLLSRANRQNRGLPRTSKRIWYFVPTKILPHHRSSVRFLDIEPIDWRYSVRGDTRLLPYPTRPIFLMEVL